MVSLIRILGAAKRVKLETYIENRGFTVTKVKRKSNGWTLYVLDRCPFNEAHRGTSCAMGQHESGALSFNCKHDGCQGRKWGDVRNLLGSPSPFEYDVPPEIWEEDRPSHAAELNGKLVRSYRPSSPIQYPSYTMQDMLKMDLEIHYLIDNILAAGQPCVIGGPKKSLKTSIALDLAISLALGKPFLGRFEVIEPRRVVMMSGESGLAVLCRTAQTICRMKGQDPQALGDRLVWSDHLPRFADEDHVTAFGDFIEQHRADVVVIDPAYLCMTGADAGNLFQMGEQLIKMNEICVEQQVTMVLLHHARKHDRSNREQRWEPIELDDLTWAGFAEWARQWILLNPAERYVGGSGRHKLWLTVGGSAGHGGEWSVDVDMGQPNDSLVGPRWTVEVLGAEEMRRRRLEEQDDELLDQIGEVLSRGERHTVRSLAAALGGKADRTRARIERYVSIGKLRKVNGLNSQGKEFAFIEFGICQGF